jgi:hypothetical protein
VQYNSSGVLAGSANLTFDGTTLTTLNTAYTGTLTGGTGVVNLGSGQFYKDASGNVGIGTTTTSNATLTINNANLTSPLYIGSQSDSLSWGGFFVNGATSSTAGAGMYGKASANLYFNAPTSYGHIWTINGGEKMRIDSSGNVGIGTSSPVTKLQVQKSGKSFQLYDASTNDGVYMVFAGSNTTKNWCIGNQFNVSGGLEFTQTSASAGTTIGSTPAMILDSSGNLLVGTTTSLASGLTVTGGNGPQFSLNTTTRYTQFNFYNSGTQKSFIAWDNTNTNLYVQNSSGGVYLTNTGTSWTSNSDERLKENLVDITNGLSKVCSLRSVIGNFIADETKKKTPFLIAQDVQTVLPEAVTTSTLKDDETNTEYLGIAYTEVIPLLVASIKELNAKVDAQAATITALQAKVGN